MLPLTDSQSGMGGRPVPDRPGMSIKSQKKKAAAAPAVTRNFRHIRLGLGMWCNTTGSGNRRRGAGRRGGRGGHGNGGGGRGMQNFGVRAIAVTVRELVL